MAMIRSRLGTGVVHQLERLFGHGTVTGLTEGQLLDRFASRRDESAFESLMERHGPMVLGVCRQFLRDPNDVEDAFQATFLVLVRKAPTLRQKELLGNWLYGVAYRVALRARSVASRRQARVSAGKEVDNLATDPRRRGTASADETIEADEERPMLHEEVSRLPERYRMPIVLCYFEGLSHDQAAARLGWPVGTVKGRLSRARELLRGRLSRRGVTVTSAAIAAQLAMHCMPGRRFPRRWHIPHSRPRSSCRGGCRLLDRIVGRFAALRGANRRSFKSHVPVSNEAGRNSDPGGRRNPDDECHLIAYPFQAGPEAGGRLKPPLRPPPPRPPQPQNPRTNRSSPRFGLPSKCSKTCVGRGPAARKASSSTRPSITTGR